MPELEHIKYNDDMYYGNNYIVYAIIDSHHFSRGKKHYEFCECKDLYLENVIIQSTFEKCDLSNSHFYMCAITKDAFFGGCNFAGVTFTNCIFEKEEMYIFMQMVSKVKQCVVKEIRDGNSYEYER